MELTELELKDYYLKSVISGDTLGVCIALNNGVNPNTRRRSDFRSALDLAIGRGHEDIINIIKEYRNNLSPTKGFNGKNLSGENLSEENLSEENNLISLSCYFIESESSEDSDSIFDDFEKKFLTSSNFFTPEA